jgi:hypothetical protein
VVGSQDGRVCGGRLPAAPGPSDARKRRSLRVWRGAGAGRTIARVDAGRANPLVRLRTEVTGGAGVRFAVWRDGAWAPAGDPVATARGVRILRVAVTCAGHRGAVARFDSVRVMAR